MANPFISEVRAFHYTVATGAEPAMSAPIAHLVITESKQAASEDALGVEQPEYGFSLVSDDGTVLAQVSAGYLAFFLGVINQALPLHGEAVMEDSLPSNIRLLQVFRGDA